MIINRYRINGRLYVLGGNDNSYSRLNDVWSSTDGKNWLRKPMTQGGRGDMIIKRYRIRGGSMSWADV